ncbi:MAG: hypothetical protein D8M52_10235 [Chlorobi bacterium]|nr:MAG: hypothetical protein F9K28_10420 [Bacteroidota bacterium]MBL1162079.1 hypothetical protein [Chlorobiota bacterium]MBZ0194069.1 hypothetical protein [Candidatus Kapabacteria bacterium]QOJ27100.1 MAG: hypothetical protein HRU79_10775 [Ignavibacteria bacterium]NOG68544.1 hypothetical protein [Chlorobiota bacterium]
MINSHPPHHRRSIRLRGYDYSQSGAYFITICTYQRKCLFGEVVKAKMQLNELGEIVAEEWVKSAIIRPEIHLDEWIVMPDHFHGIVLLPDRVEWGASGGKPILYRPPRSLGSMIAGFKSAATIRINRLRGTPGTRVWLRNYYERIIRDEAALHKIRKYITNNPMKWAQNGVSHTPTHL